MVGTNPESVNDAAIDVPELPSATGVLAAVCATKRSRASADAVTGQLVLSKGTSSQCKGLTKTQLFFLLSSKMDPRSYSIERGREFFIFMEMRERQQWASFRMTPKTWQDATRALNEELRKQLGVSMPPKIPRALVDKLAEIEQRILVRIQTGNYKCE